MQRVQGSLADPATGFSGSILYVQSSDGQYHDSDDGFENEAGGVEAGHDDFDDGDSGDNSMTLTITGNVSAPDGSFTGTVLYSDNPSGTYHDEDWGPDDDTAGDVTETDHFDDGASGNESFEQKIQGSVSDPNGFSGTVLYDDSSPNASYHDSDHGQFSDEEHRKGAQKRGQREFRLTSAQ